MIDNNNVQTGLANINAKADINTQFKMGDIVHNQVGGTTNYNDNSQYNVFILNNETGLLHTGKDLDKIIEGASAAIASRNIVTYELIKDNNIDLTDEEMQKLKITPWDEIKIEE